LDIVKGIETDHELQTVFKETEILIFDPETKAYRINVIGRGLEEKFYAGRK
jgi:hypothetical protein